MKAELVRKSYGEEQTLGELFLYSDEGDKVFECKTLELAWKDNKVRESCIPEGTYKVRLRKPEESGNFNYEHFLIEDVPDRSYILFHSGNFHYQIYGCILVGFYHKDLNKDGKQDVAESRLALRKFINKIKMGTTDYNFKLCISS